MNDSIAVFYSKCSVEFNVGLTVVTSLLMVAAVVGNIMIFVAVYSTQNLKTGANYYIVNMAFADLLLVIVVGPWSILYSLRDLKMFASIEMSLMSVLCKSVVFVGNVSSTVSIASFVLITVDRFIACVYPLKMKLITGKFRRIVLFLTWILAVPLNFHLFYYSSLHSMCDWGKWGNCYFLLRWFYPILLRSSHPHNRSLLLRNKIAEASSTTGQFTRTCQYQTTEAEPKLFAITTSIVSACFICWTPYYLVRFLLNFKPSLLTGSECKMLVSYLFFPLVSTVINPVILFLFGTNYRAALSSCFVCLCNSSRNRAHWNTQLKDVVEVFPQDFFQTKRWSC